MTTEDRHVHWRTIIDNQATSGMNIAAYRLYYMYLSKKSTVTG